MPSWYEVGIPGRKHLGAIIDSGPVDTRRDVHSSARVLYLQVDHDNDAFEVTTRTYGEVNYGMGQPFSPPRLMPTTVTSGQAPGVGYAIAGELVPTLHVRLDGRVPIFFEHHVVLWKNPDLQIGIHPLRGGFKRVVAGMPIVLTETQSPGEIAFSRDGAGHVFALHLTPGMAIQVREHQYLAATGNLDYSFTRQRGIANMLVGGNGIFVDRFAATDSEGVVWLHGYGNVFEKVLAPGEQIDVEPGGWIYRDDTVAMEVKIYGLKTGMLGGTSLVFNRFTGPGRVGIQSMYLHLPTTD